MLPARILRPLATSYRHSIQPSVLATSWAFQVRHKSIKRARAKDARSALENLKGPAITPAGDSEPAPAEAPQVQQQSRRPDENEERDSNFRTWALAANRIGSFAIIPMIMGYCVFFMDFGEHEHVFMPARRWLLLQKAEFYTLTPAELELLKPRGQGKVVKLDDLYKPSGSPEPAQSPSTSGASQ